MPLRRAFRKPGPMVDWPPPTATTPRPVELASGRASGCCTTARPAWQARRSALPRPPALRLVEKPLIDPPPLGLAAAASLARAARRGAAKRGEVLAPPWPDLVIGCGRNTAAPTLAIRRASGGRTVAAQIQDPRVGRGEFDLMCVPEHDRLRGPRVMVTTGAIHRVTAERLAAERRRFPALAGTAAADRRRADRRLEPSLSPRPSPARRDRRRRSRRSCGAPAARPW